MMIDLDSLVKIIGALAPTVGEWLPSGNHLTPHTRYSGVLHFQDETSAHIDIALKISKYSAYFKGTITTSEEGKPARQYALRGSHRVDVLTFTFWPTDPRRMVGGSGTLRIQCDNRYVKGFLAYRPDNDDDIRTVNCDLAAGD